jgi:peroxiredoxin
MATTFAERADNFTLLDQHGVTHELNGLADAAAIVIMVQGNGCPIVRNAWPAFKQVREDYRQKGVEFLMLNSNLQDDRSSILREAETFGIDAPILVDETQSVGESLGLIRTAEVLLIDPGSWDIVYRGPIDDRLTYERQKPAATEHYLRDALDALLAGQRVAIARRESLGCLINFPGRQQPAAPHNH